MQRRLFRVILIAACLVLPASALAQKHCRKGIPCGGTCIAANKTCHVGAPSTSNTRPGTNEALGGAVSNTEGAWIASTRGTTYYRAGCAGANKLVARNRISFRTEAEAKAAGYHRSVQRGC